MKYSASDRISKYLPDLHFTSTLRRTSERITKECNLKSDIKLVLIVTNKNLSIYRARDGERESNFHSLTNSSVVVVVVRVVINPSEMSSGEKQNQVNDKSRKNRSGCEMKQKGRLTRARTKCHPT